jgi:hypothetical protein
VSTLFKTQDRPITPEPWHCGEEFKPGRNGLQDVISVSAHGEVIAHVNCGFGRGETHAKLIATAPALLQLAQTIAYQYEREQKEGKFPEGRTWGTIPHDMGQQARSLVKKTTE